MYNTNSKACATGIKDREPIELTIEYYEKTKKMVMGRTGRMWLVRHINVLILGAWPLLTRA
jgi:hypothetical protein